MPYDPRPVSEGGNQGIDDTFSRTPEEGKNYRIVVVDTFDGSDWVAKDTDTLQEATDFCTDYLKKHPQMTMCHVYDKQGKCVDSQGSF